MNAVTNNPELVVFSASVIPALVLVFRFLIKLQVSGEDIYERRQSMQTATIEEQDRLIRELKQLKDACEARDRESRLQIEQMSKKISLLQDKVLQLELRIAEQEG